jgi:hypothetical protein
MGAQTQHKARPQVGRPNATQGTFASWAPQCTSATQTQGTIRTSASWAPQRNARHVRNQHKVSWSPKRKTHPQRKRPHKGALGKKMSWRTDKNKFWLGGRLFNTASPRLGAANATHIRKMGAVHKTGTYAKRNARHVRKMGAQTKN